MYTEGIFNTTGADIYYETKGAGQNILLLHAGISDSRMWDHEFHKLAENFRVTRIDLPGFGGSDFTGGKYSYTNIIKALLHHLGIDEVNILAASFGGKIAIDFALENPDGLMKMALLSPAAGGWEESRYLQEYEAEEERLYEAGKIEEAAELNYNTWILGDRHPDAVDATIKDLVLDMQMEALNKPESDASVEEIEPQDAIKNFEYLNMPILIINGTHDVQDFLKIGDLIYTEAPSAERIKISDTAHLANLEKPEYFMKIVSDFFYKNNEG